MMQSLVIYLSLASVMTLLCSMAHRRNNWGSVLPALVLYSIVFGIRYGVGTDHIAYWKIYQSALLGNDIYQKFEPGFAALITFCTKLKLAPPFFFFIVAFLQIFFLFRIFKGKEEVLPFMAFVFMIACAWLSYSNGMRQILSFCVFAYSLQFIASKEPVKYYLCILLAISFHSSALILLLVYPILRLKYEWFSNIKYQLIGLAIALVLMNLNVVSSAFGYLDDAIRMLGYGEYLSGRYSKKLDADVSIGLGFVINLVINVLIIVYSNKVKSLYPNSWITSAYNLFYIGLVCKYAFISSQLLGRANMYFNGFSEIFGAFTLYYMYKERRNAIYILIGLYVMTFVAVMNKMDINDAKYYFYWQKSEYKQDKLQY